MWQNPDVPDEFLSAGPGVKKQEMQVENEPV